jgi:CHAT domain-containing protein
MKKIIILLIIFNHFSTYSQSVTEISRNFWKLLSENKLESIYKNQQVYIDNLQNVNIKEKLSILISLQYVNKEFLDYEKALYFEDLIYKGINLLYGYESLEMQDHLSRLSQIYTSIHDWDKLKEIEGQNVVLSLKVFGEQSTEYSQATLNYSSTLTDLDEFSSALNLNKIGYDIAVNLNKEEQIIQSLINYGRIYFKLEVYEKSNENYLKALNIIVKSKKDFSVDYQIILSNLIGVNLKVGNLSKASEFSELIISKRKEIYGRKTEKYAFSIIQNGNIYFALSDYNKAIREYLVAKKILDNLKLTHTDYYFTLLNNIAMCYNQIGDYKKSLHFLIKAQNLVITLFGRDHLENIRCNSNMASIFINLGYTKKSIEILFYTSKLGCDYYLKRRIGLSKDEQIALKDLIENNFYILFSKSKELNCTQLSDLYSSWINFFGIVCSDWQYFKKNKNDSNFDLESKKLATLKKQYLNSLETNNFGEQSNKIVKDEIEISEREISKLLSINTKKVLLYEISKNIDTNAFFIDISKFSKYNFEKSQWTDSSQYLIFISDSKDSIIDYLYFDNGNIIEQELFDLYKQEVTDSEKKTEFTSEKFYNYFWKPIADKIGDAKTIYVSLGGIYNNINLNTIYNPTTGKYLMEEKDIRIVNSARDFVLSKESEKKKYTTNTASLFGFPNFDGNTTISVDTTDIFASSRNLNSFWLDSLTRGGMKAKPLPATKTEVENISTTLKSKDWKVNSFLSDDASETNIKKQQSPRILHIATHGYFFENIPMEKDENRFLGMDRQQVVQDPMLRSGLLLTGANKTLKGEPITGENGLLSAAEASLLDLRETELVVLSACETGKGEVKNSEGVYGLRKAFSDAGAQNIIMSLWKVDDKVTQEFMSRFYEIWLNEKISIREAFKKTQLEIKAKYPQPYYWGAFILVGE